MGKKVFISYRTTQRDWVCDRLLPCLRYGGAEVVIDYEHFRAGQTVIGQMDGHQDAAAVTVLVLTPEYLASDYCVHEMERALQRQQPIVPIVREDCAVPPDINQLIWADLRDDGVAAQWDKVLRECEADLGAEVPVWLKARDEARQFLARGQSVNLVISGKPNWRELVAHLQTEHWQDLGIVDMDSGATASRKGLIETMLKACGITTPVPAPPDDLGELHRALSARTLSRLALLHFDRAKTRRHYEVDLFAALRHLIMDARKLVLLVHSKENFGSILPHDHELSEITINTVELRGR
ncbi:MAG: toll/interleukin-1 receptor domain-containing protein [Blastocatellia bacterium]